LSRNFSNLCNLGPNRAAEVKERETKKIDKAKHKERNIN
jgi:hypothetical protein